MSAHAAPATPATRARIPARTWTALMVVGLAGQLAWTVENLYLNVFVYNTITTDPTVIAILVAASAVAATLATFLMGAASDRLRKRRPFIALGYLLWGATTAAFGLVQPGSGAVAAQAVGAAVLAIVLLDCLMSFLGATANDAAFNAWVTDSTVPENRGRVDGVLAVMPLMAMLLVFGALDGLTQAAQWRAFFGIVGGLTAAVGVLAWFTIRDSDRIEANPDGYLAAVLHGLRPSSVRANPRLYVVLAAWAVVGVSTQVFLPYLIIYIQHYLRIDDYALILAVVLLGASVASVVGGRVIDRVGKRRAIVPAVGIMVAGMVGMFVARSPLALMAAGTVMMSGFMVSFAALGASVRDETPRDRVGTVQGLRMVAVVLVPMVLGPFIGAWVIKGADETFVDLGVTKQVPTPWVFVAAAVVAVLVLVPMAFLRRLPAIPGMVPDGTARGAESTDHEPATAVAGHEHDEVEPA
ncbi:MAG: MFS transporter [Actinomycetota bacterium]|nr:MFS transporter [Actinomycetota bacterium]